MHGSFVEPKKIEKGTKVPIDLTNIKDIKETQFSYSETEKIDPSSKPFGSLCLYYEIFGLVMNCTNFILR